MTTFVIQNQNGHFWSKQKNWTDGRDRRAVFRTVDKVDAINLVFELSSKDVSLRANHAECEVDDIGNPLIEASSVPLPADAGAPEAEADAAPAPDSEIPTSAALDEEEIVSESLENSDQRPQIESDPS